MPPFSGGSKIGCVITTSIPHDRIGRGGNGPRVQSVRVPKYSGDCMRGDSALDELPKAQNMNAMIAAISAMINRPVEVPSL